MKKVLVTGAAGFVGRNTVTALIDRGWHVIALDRDGEGLNKLDGTGNVTVDIACGEAMDFAVTEYHPDAILHLAAQSTVAGSIRDWWQDVMDNIIGTINVVQAAKRHGVKRIVYAASGGTVYGQPSKLPIAEDAPLNPISPYGISKLAGEFYVKISGIPYAILRYPNIYGPGQRGDGEAGVVAIWIDRILHGWKPRIFGDGSKMRDYVYVKDIAELNAIALDSDACGVYNIGSGTGTTDLELFEIVADVMKWNYGCAFVPDRPNDVHSVYFDTMKASTELDWKPKVSLEDGIRQTVEASHALQWAR